MAREELVKVPAVILGSRLRAKRKALRMSQHQLGGEDFSPSYVSAVERGKIRPSLKALYILADRLGEPVTHFLQDDALGRTGDTLEETVAAATIAVARGQPQEAINKLEAVSLEGHTAELRARVHLTLGQAHIASHQPEQAHRSLQEALRLAESTGNALLAAYARLYQGVAYYEQQKAGLALEFHRRCLQAVADGSIKDFDFSLQTYRRLGEDLVALGQGKDALAYLDAAIKLSDEAANLRTLATRLWALSADYASSNDLLQARAFAQKSLLAFEALQMLTTAAGLHSVYGSALSQAGQRDAAQAMLRQAQTMGEHIGDTGVAAAAMIRLGELETDSKNYAHAERLIAAGMEQASAMGDELTAGQGLMALAEVHAAQSRRDAAAAQFQASIAKLEKTGASDALSKAYFRYGQALVSWGESATGSAVPREGLLAEPQGIAPLSLDGPMNTRSGKQAHGDAVCLLPDRLLCIMTG